MKTTNPKLNKLLKTLSLSFTGTAVIPPIFAERMIVLGVLTFMKLCESMIASIQVDQDVTLQDVLMQQMEGLWDDYDLGVLFGDQDDDSGIDDYLMSLN